MPAISVFLIIFAAIVVFVITKSVIAYRTQDYGNLLSLGLSYRKIRNSVWIENLIFSFSGIVFASVFWLLTWKNLLESWKVLMPGFYYSFDASIFLPIFGAGLAISFLGTLGPLHTVKTLKLSQVIREKNFG